MSKEVTISLRGFLEELPEEVAQLLTLTAQRLMTAEATLAQTIQSLEDSRDVPACLLALDKIRREFYKIDNRLDDCASILVGYEQHVNSPTPQSTPPAEGESEE